MSKLCKRILLILAVFSSFLTLFACSAIQIDTYHVELPQDKYQLRVGQEIEALPIVSKNGQECDLEVSYHSYDASIATYVDGKIVALKSGEVRIKVTLKNNSKVYATALVTVVNDDSLIVDFNYEKTMIKGTTQLLTYELLVEKNRKLTFTSSNENVATIDELGNIKAITVGTTTIETVVSSLYDEGVSKTYKLVIEVKDLTFAINYVLDGGTNSENNPNEYVPEKLPLLLENPTKSGYKFVGWYDNENFIGESITEISAGTMGDVTLYAKWNALDYRISYELNGGTNAENPDGYDVSDLPVSLHAPSRTGYIFKGWYMGENRVLAIPVGTTGNVVVSAKWEPITYTIDFDTNGGLPILSSIDYTIESDSFTLQEITKAGYTFDGWYNGETKVTEITTGTYGNMTLVAKWTADLYTISYDLADGVNSPENPTSYTIESGLITLKDPTRVGYTFVGWYNGEQLVTTIDSNTLENISLTAKWTVNSYKLTFDVDGNLTEKTFKYGESVIAIENPTKVGHTFAGWSEELPVKMPANDLYVSATWTVNSYKLTFDVDGNLTEKTFKYGESVIAIENPTKVGHTFAGWSEELPVKMPANDLYVSATWTVNSYKLTFAVDGNLTEKTFKYGESVTAIENPTKVGYTFAGWSPVLPETMPAEDLTVKATWTVNSYDITYDFAGGEFKNVDYLNTPLHKFAITDYLTYQAVTGAEVALIKNTPAKFWVYILLKNTNNDGLYEIVQIADGSANVTAEYDYVIAWHSGLTDASAKSILQKMLASSSSYIGGYVKLSNVPSSKTADCNITAEVYKASDIVINDPLKTSYTIEDSVELPTPSRTGYVFDGWYVNGTKVTSITRGTTGNVTLKANWKVMTYQITLDPVGGRAKYATWEDFVSDFLKDFCTYVWNDPTRITDVNVFWDKSYATNDEIKGKILSFFTDNYDKWGFLSEELDAGIKKANWTSYDKTNYLYYRCNLTEYLAKTKRTEWPASCGAFDGMSDPAWISPICDPKYATWDEFVADFLKDFCTYVWNNPTKITSAANFWELSYAENGTIQAKIVSFFTDNAEKWGFLSDELDAGIKKANWASYDKTNWYYYRCNLAEYLTKTKRTAWPASCGAFDGMSDPAWVGYYELNYTVDDNIMLPQLYKEGYTFLGWFNGDTKVDMIKAGTTGNLNLVAKWEKIKVYHDLNLDLDGGTLDEAPTNYLEGEEFVLPIPTKEGYIFLGWYNGGEKVEKIFATETSDISLVAKWKITTDHEGTDVDPYSVDDALKVAGTLTKGNSTTDKYYIKGIVSEITELSTSYGNATFKITVNGKTILVFRAKNEGNQNFTSTDDLYVGDEVVIYGNITNYNGTLEITNCYVVSNNKVARPEPIEEPEVVDKTLQEIIDMDDATNKEASYKITVIVLGWGKSLTSYDTTANKYGNMIVSDLEGLNKIVVFGATATISALVWDSTNGKYTYTNKQDFLTNAITKSINIGDTLELIVIRDSYNGNTQLNAIVTKVTPKPAVTSNLIFDLDGGTCADLPTSYEEGNELSLPTPTKEGYDFLGWEYNGTIITSITATMTGDLTLTAKWKESGTTLYFEKVTSVNDITDDGLYLIVYENGEKAYAFNSSLATLDATNNYKELALTALGIAVDDASNSVTFRITKNTDGTFAILSASGNYIYRSKTSNGLEQSTTKANSTNTITIDAKGNVLIVSSNTTLKFNSASDQTRFRYYKSDQSSISLYKYSTTSSDPSKTHNINYVNLPEGATNSNPTSYTEGDTITLVDPVLSGYTFEGWYDNAECTGTKITEISGYTTDITLYAKFAKIPTHSISYKYNVDSTDITNDNPTEYAEGDSTVLKDAKLTNYAFSGWYLDSEYTNKITAIDHSWTADVVIYGKFILDTLTETIVATATFSANTNIGKVSNYTNTWSVTCDNVTWTMKNFNNNNNGWPYVRAGSKNNASVAEIITDSTMVDAITKVVVTVDKVTANSVNSFKLIVASDKNFENVIETVNLTIKTGENTFSCATPMAKCYYKIVIDCKKASSNGIVQISKLEYYTKK